jgi:hypothetical protein
MGGYNPVLNGIMRGMQLASLIQNQRIRQQNAQSIEGARQEAARRNAALEARQGELDLQRAREKANEFRLKAREAGAVPLDSGQTQRFRQGEDFSVELAPGMATTASASAVEGPSVDGGRGGLFAWPGPVERGQLDLEQRLEQFARQREILAEHAEPRQPRFRFDEDETGEQFRMDIDTLERTPTGIKAKPTLETPSSRRTRESAETRDRAEAFANVLLDDAGGDPERALNLFEQEITRPNNPERSDFLSRQRIAIRQLLKGARTEGAPPRPKEPNAGDRTFMDILKVDADELETIRAIRRDLPRNLAAVIERVENQPEPQLNPWNPLGYVGLASPPEKLTLEEELGANIDADDLALLQAAGIDVAQLGRTRRGLVSAKPKTKAKRGLVPARTGKPADPLGIR